MSGYKNGNDILCKDSNSDLDLWHHIAFGSNSDVKTRFISCTKSIGVAQKYAYDDKMFNTVPTPIVLIDTAKLSEHNGCNLYDCYDPDIIKSQHLIGTPAENFAPASQEVIVENQIPADCTTTIPPLFVDILRALEACKYDTRNGSLLANSKQYDTIIDCINSLIISNDLSIFNLLDDCKLSALEKDFIKQYYFGERKSLSQISQSMFNNDIGLAGCIKIQALKNIVGATSFKKGIYDYLTTNQDVLLQDYSNDDIKKLMELINPNNDINPIQKYVDSFDSTIRLTANLAYSNAYQLAPKSNGTLVLGGSTAVITKEGESKFLPYEAKIVSDENGTYHVTGYFAQTSYVRGEKIKLSTTLTDEYLLAPKQYAISPNAVEVTPPEDYIK